MYFHQPGSYPVIIKVQSLKCLNAFRLVGCTTAHARCDWRALMGWQFLNSFCERWGSPDCLSLGKSAISERLNETPWAAVSVFCCFAFILCLDSGGLICLAHQHGDVCQVAWHLTIWQLRRHIITWPASKGKEGSATLATRCPRHPKGRSLVKIVEEMFDILLTAFGKELQSRQLFSGKIRSLRFRHSLSFTRSSRQQAFLWGLHMFASMASLCGCTIDVRSAWCCNGFAMRGSRTWATCRCSSSWLNGKDGGPWTHAFHLASCWLHDICEVCMLVEVSFDHCDWRVPWLRGPRAADVAKL